MSRRSKNDYIHKYLTTFERKNSMEMETTTNDAGDSHHTFDGTIVTHCNIVDQSSDSCNQQGQQQEQRNHDLQEQGQEYRRDFHDLVLISSPTATSPETQQTAIEVSTIEGGGEEGLPSTVSATTEFTTNSPSAGATMKSSMATYHHHIEFITPPPPPCWGATRSNPNVHPDSRATVPMDAITISTPPPPSSSTKRKREQSSIVTTPMVITPFHINNNHFEDEMVENEGGGAEPRRISCPCGTCSVVVVEETDDPPKPPPLEYILVPTLEPTTDTAMSQNINISSRLSSSMYPRFSSLSHWTVQQQQQKQEQPRHDTTPSWHYKQDQGLRMTRTTTTTTTTTTPTTTTLEDEKIMTTIDDTWKASKWAIRALGFNHTCHHGAESLIFSSDASEEEEEEENYDEDDDLDGIKYLSFAYV